MRRITEALSRSIAPLGLVAFWCGMAAAAHAYPEGYDWRYQTISLLLYSDRNPRGFFWAWLGLEVCGLCGIAWTFSLRRRLGARGVSALGGLPLLQAGFICMCCAVLPDRLLPVPRGHEILAIAAFVAICTGMMREMFLARDGLNGDSARGTGARLGVSLQGGAPLVPLV